MEEQKVSLIVEEKVEEVSQAETSFFSKFSVDCRDKENVVGVICREEGYDLLVEKIGYEGFCSCFIGKNIYDVEILRIWCEHKLVNP